ncbi:MADS-box protein 22 [Quillaja saponaria]|uniref:MADS-box protein 22 n=1 Tax=Quillaja saponaria TaxID=32244 RepID=A0AAD7LSE7_QUISA|nr:MADS-box protein 22 [Quillaja saponaria]
MVKQQYLAALSMLEKEKKLLETLKEKKVTAAANGEGTSVRCWWEQGIERMGLEELEPLKEALEALKENVQERAENMTRIQPPSTAAATSFVALLNGDVSEDQELAW